MTLRQRIRIEPNGAKTHDRQPDFRVYAGDNTEIGGGWHRSGKTSGKPYVSLTLAAPEIGPRRIFANIAPAAGGLEGEMALLWNAA